MYGNRQDIEQCSPTHVWGCGLFQENFSLIHVHMLVTKQTKTDLPVSPELDCNCTISGVGTDQRAPKTKGHP